MVAGGDSQYLNGGTGADRLIGGYGADQYLYGEAGNDTLIAGGGGVQRPLWR